MRDPPSRRRFGPALPLFAAVAVACCAARGRADEVPPAPDPAAAIAEHAAPADAEDAPVELPGEPDTPGEMPLTEDDLAHLVDQAVEARLAGIPRPRYIPATDLVPPKGLLLHATRPAKGEFPFALALSGYMQLRWFEFARSATQWTDAAGQVRQINNINTFNLNRYLINFAGHLVDERLLYNFALFGTSDLGSTFGVVPLGMAGWKFSEAAIVGAGVTPVPGTREWLEPTSWTLGADRSMANTFFRPGFSPGVLATGALAEDTVHYQAGIWNAIDGGTAGVLRRGTSMAFAGNTWWEPWAPFGFGMGDMEHHDEPAIRLGTSGVYAPTYSRIIPDLNPENTIVRLSDGTPLATTGVLGAGTKVDSFLYNLATVDAGLKYRGWAVNFEYYFRLLDSFKGTGPFDRSSIFDQGGMAYLSWCFVPRTYEAYARSSVVTGPFGTGQEYGGGLNAYIRRSRQARLTLEALHMNRNPANNVLYPYRAGYTGTAIQTQLVVSF
ncbi:MAG: hypothetical protein EBX35_06980 [Planctomycetia bacterium]|nr:hypothetical protein [Planctomycetia bacterium]